MKGPTLRRPTVAAIILAAGEGARFGGDKLTAPLDGRPLVQHAIDAASSSCAVACFLVVGAHADAVVSRIDSRRCAIVTNTRWRDGLSSSVRAGAAAAVSSDACLFVLADQPFVTCSDLNALIDKIERRPSAIVALRARDIWGAPIVFPRRDFGALAKLRGDTGAKSYAQSQRTRLRYVQAADPRAFDDVDTAADLALARRRRAR